MTKVKLKNLDFLFQYLDTPSPSGHEILAQRVWIEECKKYLNENDSTFIDYSQSAYVLKKSNNPNAFKVAITAHVDEVSMTVESVLRNGYVTVFENGGVDPQLCQGRRVQIMTKSGFLPGITTTVAPHLTSSKSKAEIKDIHIDLGFHDSKELVKIIQPGDPVVFKQDSFFMGDYLVSKALDNKISGYVLTQILKDLQNVELDYDLYLINCSQEEVGKRGAEVMSRLIKPDISIVIDVGHDTNVPGVSQRQNFFAGMGPLVLTAPAVQKNFLSYVLSRCEEEKIPHQIRAKGKVTGTDADVFSHWSPITSLIQIPIKYMHSTQETCSVSDVRNTKKLLLKVLEGIKNLDQFGYN